MRYLGEVEGSEKERSRRGDAGIGDGETAGHGEAGKR